jgi:lipoyl-dependent peroxiredoxin
MIMGITRRATANWKGSGKEGSGTVSTTSGVLKDVPHSFHTRFVSEDGKAGTNPEELIAAAHASCFSMKTSFVLGAAGFIPTSLDVTSTVKMDKVGDGQGIVGIHLDLKASVPGISAEQFQKCAEDAKTNCPVSQALKAVPITLTATLA